MRRNVSDHVLALLAGHAVGHYQLPASILDAAATSDRLLAAFDRALQDQAAYRVDDVLAQLTDDAVRAAAEDRLPAEPGKQLSAATARAATAESSVAVLEPAVDQADAELSAVAGDEVDAIVEALAAALEETLAEVRSLPPFPSGIPPAEAVPFLPDALSEAWHRLDRASTRYEAIRAGQFHVEHFGHEARLGDLFAEFGDPVALWGDRFFNRSQTTWKPWPAGRLERMLWLASLQPGAVVLLPAAEQDNRSRALQDAHGLKSAYGARVA